MNLFRIHHLSVLFILCFLASIKTAVAKEKEYFNLSLDVKGLVKVLEQDPKNNKMAFQLNMMKSLNLNKIELSLIHHPDFVVQPFLLANVDVKELRELLTAPGLFSNFFEQEKDQYKLKLSELKTNSNDDSVDAVEPLLKSLRFRLHNDHLVIATKTELETYSKSPKLYLSNLKLGEGFDKEYLIEAHLDVPDQIPEGWAKDLLGDFLKDLGPMAFMIKPLIGLLDGLTEDIAIYDQLKLGGSWSEESREIVLKPKFHKDTWVNQITEQFSAKEEPDEVFDLVSTFRAFKDMMDVNCDIISKGKESDIKLSWNQPQDKSVNKEFGTFMRGIFMRNMSMNMTPTEGRIKSGFRFIPLLDETYESKGQLKIIMDQFIDQLHPWAYFDSGDKPHFSMQSEPLFFPNAELGKVEFEVISIQDAEGKSVMREEEKNSFNKMKLCSSSLENLRFNIKVGTKDESIQKAKVKFKLSYPESIVIVEFKAGDKDNLKKKSSGMTFTLKQLERDVASVTAKGCESLHFFGYDKEGNCLQTSSGSSSDTSRSYKFRGVIERLVVVGVKKNLVYEHTADLDLNGTKEIELPEEPNDSVFKRYDLNTSESYSSLEKEALNNLTVKWEVAKEGSWRDKIYMELPKGTYRGSADWEIHLLNESGEVKLDGSGQLSGDVAQVQFEREALKDVALAFGKVEFKIKTGIEDVVIDNFKTEEKVISLSDKSQIKVRRNKNVIEIEQGNYNILTINAFDEKGYRIKADNFSKTNNNMTTKKFWGVPEKVKLQLSSREIKHVVAFHSEQRSLDKKLVEKVKGDIENEREIFSVLRKIGKGLPWNMKNSPLGLASVYFLHDHRKKPLHKIELNVAESDPIGAKYFGYKVKPYKNYFFTYSDGTSDNGVNKIYEKKDKETVYKWDKGEIKAKPFKSYGTVIAVPVKSGMPMYALNYDRVYRLGEHKPTDKNFVPKSFYNTDWKEVKLILLK